MRVKVTKGWDSDFRRLNARWPWLKLAILIVVAILGTVTLVKAFMPAERSVYNVELYADVDLRPPFMKASTPPEVIINREQIKNKKLIALTFDDGPAAATTPRLLQILAEKEVSVTFFMLGNLMQRYPKVVQQAVQDGHEVGSHTMGHINLRQAADGVVKTDTGAMDWVFRDILGWKVELVRPPYGLAGERTGKKLILWSVDPEDWRSRNAIAVREHVVEHAFDGAIVLLHDIYPTTIEAISGVVDDLRAQGYEFLTVSELAAARGVKLENGVKYYKF